MEKLLVENKEMYQKTMEVRLGKLGARIDQLLEEAEKFGGAAKAEFNELKDDLRLKQELTRQRFQNLIEATGNVWEDLREGFEQSSADLKETVDRAVQKIKKNFPSNPAIKWIGVLGAGLATGYFISRFIHKTN